MRRIARLSMVLSIGVVATVGISAIGVSGGRAVAQSLTTAPHTDVHQHHYGDQRRADGEGQTTVPLYQYEANTDVCAFGCNPYPPAAYWSTTSGNGSSVPGTPYTMNATLQAWIAPTAEPNTYPLFDCYSGLSIAGSPGVTGYMNTYEADCNGQTRDSVAIDGYIYLSPSDVPPGTTPVKLYLCQAPEETYGNWYMTTIDPNCQYAPGYSQSQVIGYGLASSFDYSAPPPTTTINGCSPSDHQICTGTTLPPYDVNQATVNYVTSAAQCEGGTYDASTGACIANCQSASATLGCGQALGTFANLPPVPLPSGSIYTPETFGPSGTVEAEPTVIVGDATDTGSYSQDEADFIYSTLGICTEDAGFVPDDFLLYHAPADMLGQIQDPASYFGVTETQLESGVVLWVPPQCEHWYLDAPTSYDTYYSGGGLQSVPNSTMPFLASSMSNLVSAGGQASWAGFSGSDCGLQSTATTCDISERTVVATMLSYELVESGGDLDAAIQGGINAYQDQATTLSFIQKGCPLTTQYMVINPSGQGESTAAGLLSYISGVGYYIAHIECITIPQGPACQSVLTKLFGSGASFDNWINYLMDPAGFAQQSLCDYTVAVSDSDPVGSFDNANDVAKIATGVDEQVEQSIETMEDPPPTDFGTIRPSHVTHGKLVASASSPTTEPVPLTLGMTLPIQAAVDGSAGLGTTGYLQQSTVAVSEDSRNPSQTSVVTALNNTPGAGTYDTYTATVTGPTKATGTVTFTDNNGVICENMPVDSTGTAVCQAQVGNEGTHTIVAGYSGDGLLRPSVSPEGLDILAGRQDQTIDLSPVFVQTAGTSVGLSGYATASSGLPVTFSVSAASAGVCSVSGTQLSAVGSGTCTVLADQGGNENYNAAPEASESFSVITSSLLVTISGVSFSGPGQNITFPSEVADTGQTVLNNLTVTSSDGAMVTCDSTELSPGESTNCFNTYVTTAADVAAGSIANVETAQASGATDSAGTTGTFESFPELAMDEKTNVPDFTGPGQSLVFTYQVWNYGNVPLNDVSAGDSLGLTCPQSTLAIGQTETCTVSYTTTDADVAATAVTDGAQASATAPDGTNVGATYSTTVPYVGVALTDVPDVDQFGLSGFPVSFNDEVTNTSGVTLTGLAVIDESDSQGASCPQGTLLAGQSETCTYTHTTSDSDISTGAVNDRVEVTASASLASGFATPVADASVSVPYVAPDITFTSPDSFASTPKKKVTIKISVGTKDATIIASNLPNGLTFNDAKNGKATITGTPKVAAGSYPVYLTAVDAGGTGEQVLNLDLLAFTSKAAATFTAGKSNKFTVSAVGGSPGEPVRFALISGAAPPGLTFVDNGNGTATLSGKPTNKKKKVYGLTIALMDAYAPNGLTVTQNFTLTVDPKG